MKAHLFSSGMWRSEETFHGEELLGIFPVDKILPKYFKEENLSFVLARYLGHNLGHRKETHGTQEQNKGLNCWRAFCVSVSTYVQLTTGYTQSSSSPNQPKTL